MRARGNFHFCHFCGAPFDEHICGKTELLCGVCGTASYRNALPVANLLIPFEDGLVGLRRGNEPKRGLIAITGGFIMYGESWRFAAAREAQEEVQVLVKQRTDIIPYHFESIPNGTQLVTFGLLPSPDLYDMHEFVPSAEALERCIIRKSTWQKQKTEIAFDLHVRVIERYFHEYVP